MSTDAAKTTSTKSFEDLIQQPAVLQNLTVKLGFTQPTPIQEAIIPEILRGRDVFAGAKTGSGKTMAFLAPIAQLILQGKARKALILAPTRELAIQIDEEAMNILEGQKDLLSIPLYGGVPMDQQVRALRVHKPSIYIATPGRMLDFISEGELDLGDIDIAVLDEADRMCDMGFSPQITDILRTVPEIKQHMMFSATLPKEANDIMKEFLKDPVSIQIDPPDESSSNILHQAILLNRKGKLPFIREFIADTSRTSLIFTRTRKGADRLYESLSGRGTSLGILHGGFSMNERERTIRSFRDGKIKHLVATDVAARGLDVDHVTHVVHYDLPEQLDDYIHRSGRAGRAHRSGFSLALVDSSRNDQKQAIHEFANTINIEILDQGKKGKTPTSSSKEHRTKQTKSSSEAKNRSTPKSDGPTKKGRRNSQKHQTGSDSSRPKRRKRSQKKKTSHRQGQSAKPQARKEKRQGILSKTKTVLSKLIGRK